MAYVHGVVLALSIPPTAVWERQICYHVGTRIGCAVERGWWFSCCSGGCMLQWWIQFAVADALNVRFQ